MRYSILIGISIVIPTTCVLLHVWVQNGTIILDETFILFHNFAQFLFFTSDTE